MTETIILQELLDRISSLESELSQIKKIATFRRRVDMLDFGLARAFVYTDDLCYIQASKEHKRFGTEPGPLLEDEPREINSCYDDETQPLLAVLLAHYWKQKLDFVFVDIGCQYGFSAMSVARMIKTFAKDNRVFAFDCGIAGDLVPFNLLLNGLQDRIVFERLAVSDRPGPRTIFMDMSHSEDNRIVNPTVDRAPFSTVVMSTSLDEYVRFREHLIVKVDTQGAEPEVFAGMQRLMKERFVTILTEFTPHAMRSRVNPAEWLAALSPDFFIFDAHNVHPTSNLYHRMPEVRLEGFVERVDANDTKHTDLLLVPKKLPGVEDLVSRVKCMLGSTAA